MRVLRINTTYNKGGAALSAMNIQLSMTELGVDTWMLSARDFKDYTKRLLSLNETKSRLRINVLAYRLFGVEGFTNSGLWHEILANIDQFDLIHLHNVHGYYMPSGILRKLLSKPCVWTLHDFWLVTGGPGFPPPPLDLRSRNERLFPFANFRYPAEWFDRSMQRRQKILSLIQEFNPSLVAISHIMADRLVSMGLHSSNLSVIQHGFFDSVAAPNAEEQIEAKKNKGWPLNKHIFLFCAAQVDNPLKGCDVFLDALNTLQMQDSWIAYIIGEKFDAAMRRVSELGLNVQFIGKVSELEMRELFRACDTYVTPTFDETFGRTVVEALAEGARVVCSDLPVLREVSEGHASYFPVGDASILSQKLSAFLEIPSHDDRFIIANSIREKFSRKVMAQKYLDLYNLEIINKQVR